MKSFKAYLGAWVVLGSILLLSACGGNELDIPDQPLEGTINGEAWRYGSANAFRLSADGLFQARFLSDREPVIDPCTRPFPGLVHVKAIFRPSIGDFSVAPVAIDNNQVQAAFEISPSTSLIAVSGFMSIFDINNSAVVGYLQVILDDGNSVEGAFRMSICD